MMNLLDLKPGESAVVRKLHGTGPLRRRFNDMGIVPGTSLQYIKPAPLGDPIQIKVKGMNISIRKNDAKDVEIE